MIFKKLGFGMFGIAAAIFLLSRTSIFSSSQKDVAMLRPSGDDANLTAVYSDLGDAGGKVFTLNPNSSAVRIYVFRAGRAAKLGHNHVLSAPQFTGFFHLPHSGASSARFDLEFRLDKLEIDNPAYRSSLGRAFSSSLPPSAIEGTREHMLGEENLQAGRFPFVRVHSLQIFGESPKSAAKVQVEIHGQKREIWVPLSVEDLPERLSVTGSFMLRQTDLACSPTPYWAGYSQSRTTP